MIDGISIANFRGIKECSIEDLSTVNLFIGKNNSGKSSILEALCFSKVPFQPVDELGGVVLQELLNRRAHRIILSTEEFSYKYKTENKISLEFSFEDENKVSIEATCGEHQIDYDVKCLVEGEMRPAVSFRNRLNQNVLVLSLFEERIGTDSPDGISFLKRQLKAKTSPDVGVFKKYLFDNMPNFSFLSDITLIDFDFINNMEQFERAFWGKLIGSRTDKEVTSILNEVYQTEIEHFTFKPYSLGKERRRDSDRYKLFSTLKDIALHIDDYGDGFRYAFTILTSALLFKKRALLIEEIESHQHAGSLKKLIPKLVEIAKTNNLQLFVTTHSFEVWRYFYGAYADQPTREKDFRSFHVVRDSETGIVNVSQEYSVPKIKDDIFEIEY
jgi:predicted ATP-dependent endonuclease of OLD family